MKKLLFSNQFNTPLADIWLVLLRVFSAAFMLTHGYPKLTRLFAEGEIQFGDPIGIGPAASLTLAVFAEFFCSILVGLGLFTRLAAIPLMITMSVAAFIAHGADPFGRKEMALLYLLLFTTLLVFGAGKYSLDRLWGKK
ncbi:MAG: DoxX family protein [Verrucomicrobiae bacterium]|nr:DoxX family protein [Verrucomicrobiae bacterium]